MLRCDVVIVNFNTGAFLRDAVNSVLRAQSVAHIYVIDNASSDESLRLLPQDQRRLTVIRNAENIGFAKACNIGLTRAACRNVLLLNPDCQVIGDAIDCLINVLRSSERVGMVGPLLLNPDGSEQAGGRRRIPVPEVAIFRAAGFCKLQRIFGFQLPDYLLHERLLPAGPIEVEAISGACMMVRAEMIADVGALDEEYFLHAEDLDWCMRASRAGWHTLFVPDAKAIHYKGISSRNRRLTVEYYKHRGMVRFYHKLLGDGRPRWLIATVTALVWVRFGGVAALELVKQGSRRIVHGLRLVPPTSARTH